MSTHGSSTRGAGQLHMPCGRRSSRWWIGICRFGTNSTSMSRSETGKGAGRALGNYYRNVLADYFGRGVDEMALTRNKCHGGHCNSAQRLPSQGRRRDSGDESLLRENISIKILHLPVGPIDDDDDEMLSIFEAAIGDKTKLVSIPHVYAIYDGLGPARACMPSAISPESAESSPLSTAPTLPATLISSCPDLGGL
ncbi:hypothetical protein K504DRAFT_451522 [Pleomassaria siparia CBS 279.74]|uniref:Uncharacterized protein n=1 Tax=Pleomassaria siparia CBS 279.74 TaxID=1314801 RepID=A0A6G1JTX3_9PLEO|nr:hypothetical protein K504DRAFT_451522 [Pleomassaria siparia CBS 279.74]